MSAYVVDHAHIDVLVDLAEQYQRAIPPHKHGLGRLNFAGMTTTDYSSTELGQMLYAENLRSVAARYPNDPEMTRPDEPPYMYRATHRRYSHSQALLAIRGYEYQACESADWEQTTAHAFCRALRHLVVSIAIPEQPDDRWTWTDADLGRSEVMA